MVRLAERRQARNLAGGMDEDARRGGAESACCADPGTGFRGRALCAAGPMVAHDGLSQVAERGADRAGRIHVEHREGLRRVITSDQQRQKGRAAMPYAPAAAARLYYEETGSGYPVIFVHEFANDHRGWDSQVAWFSRHYRCIACNARGYPPSDVPDSDVAYGHEQAAADIAAVMRHLGVERAHIVGLSMGGYATLVFGLRYPAM